MGRRKKLNPQARKMKKLAKRWRKLSRSAKKKYKGKFSNYVKAHM